MTTTFSGAAQPRAHIDLPPGWDVVRLQGNAWYEDVEAFCARLDPNVFNAEIRAEVTRQFDALAYQAQRSGGVVMALGSGASRRDGFQVASLVVSLVSAEPYEASLEPVRLALDDTGDAAEEFDTPSGPALMIMEQVPVQEELAPLVGAHQWRARAYLPVAGTPHLVVAQATVTGRQQRSRELAASVAARIVHSFELRDG